MVSPDLVTGVLERVESSKQKFGAVSVCHTSSGTTGAICMKFVSKTYNAYLKSI